MKRPRELVRVERDGDLVVRFEDLRDHRPEIVAEVRRLVAGSSPVRVRVVAGVADDPTSWRRRAVVTELEHAFDFLAMPLAFAGLVVGGPAASSRTTPGGRASSPRSSTTASPGPGA